MQETIREMSKNCYSNWEILSHLMSEGLSRPAAVRAITAALRLPADEVDFEALAEEALAEAEWLAEEAECYDAFGVNTKNSFNTPPKPN